MTNFPQPLPIPSGISDFAKLRAGGFFYIDKSSFIAEFAETAGEVLLIPRPRRFGKTLNMTMLQCWYERLPDGSLRKGLFEGLGVVNIPGKHHELRGAIPVISLSFKEVKELSWEKARGLIAQVVKSEVRRLKWWWDTERVDSDLRSEVTLLLQGKADDALLTMALRVLSEALTAAAGHPPLLLIDEYDAPIHAGIEHGFYDEVVQFFRNFFSAGLKDNPFLWRGVLTGILRVSKENVFSGLNNLSVFPLTNTRFQRCFGLLEDEVEAALDAAGLSLNLPMVRSWYNGYLFGDTTVYNPWSVMSYLADPGVGCQPHWVNTASTALLGKAIADGDGILHRELEGLLQGEGIERTIDDHVSYHSGGIRPTDIWSFLLYSGYLSPKTRPVMHGRVLTAELRLPNEEVKSAYEILVRDWTERRVGSDTRVADMLDGLVQGDQERFERPFRELVTNTLSFHDVTADKAESFYHAFVIGMLVYLNATHEVRSNRESGYGRYDVMVEPRDPTRYPGVVIEFKIVSKDSTIEETLESAHRQMQEKKYGAELQARGCSRVVQWAIVFRGKEVGVGVREG
jgi:hypothetical protein